MQRALPSWHGAVSARTRQEAAAAARHATTAAGLSKRRAEAAALYVQVSRGVQLRCLWSGEPLLQL